MSQDWLETPFSLLGKKIWVAGHSGLVGSALMRTLAEEGGVLLTASHFDLDLRNQKDTLRFVYKERPDVIVIAAAKVGGIYANDKYPADFLYDNLMIEANIIHAAQSIGVEKLLFLGSSCIYPKEVQSPISETALLSGALESSNEAYAIAKIAGIKLCQSYRKQYGCDFITAMPCNLYGPGDRFDALNSHVIPALMMKAHEAKRNSAPTLEIWGSGKPRREFLYADDLAQALVLMLKNYSSDKPLNIGAGEDIEIGELARLIVDAVGYEGELSFNLCRPDGVMCKLMDSSRIFEAGWSPQTPLKEGLQKAYEYYLEQLKLEQMD